jgi:hypothetical protein
MKALLTVIAITLLLLASSVSAKDKVVRLEGIKIKADNEAPQVMYIIPWQNPEGAERLYTPIRASEVERLKPLDPYTFNREIQLHTDWIGGNKSAIDLVQE